MAYIDIVCRWPKRVIKTHRAACALNPKVTINKYRESLEDTLSRKSDCHVRRIATAPCAAAVSGFMQEGGNWGFRLPTLHNTFMTPVWRRQRHARDIPNVGVAGRRENGTHHTVVLHRSATSKAPTEPEWCWAAIQQSAVVKYPKSQNNRQEMGPLQDDIYKVIPGNHTWLLFMFTLLYMLSSFNVSAHFWTGWAGISTSRMTECSGQAAFEKFF